MCRLALLLLKMDILSYWVLGIFGNLNGMTPFFEYIRQYVNIHSTSSCTQPKQKAPKGNIDQQMLPQTPRHGVQVLGRKHGPDEQVRPQRRARRHDKRHARRREDGQQDDVAAVRLGHGRRPRVLWLSLVLVAVLQEKQIRRRRPEEGAGPVADEGEDADGDDVEAADAVVRAGEVDGGDCVGAPEGEEGRVLEDDGGRGDFGDGEVGGLEGLQDDAGEEEQGDVGGAGLGHGEEGA